MVLYPLSRTPFTWTGDRSTERETDFHTAQRYCGSQERLGDLQAAGGT